VRLRRAGLDHVEVLPNTVAGLPDAAPLEAVRGPLKIIWIGRCAPEKRILPFVRAAVAALDEVGTDKINFTIVGDGPQLGEAKAIAGIRSGIAFLGRQDHGRIPGLLSDAHLAALTSYGFDNQPMTIVEAVMALRGVVYCDPALSEGLDGPGILAPRDEIGLGETFRALAQDPGRAIAASQAAVEVRDGFSPERHAAELIMRYRKLIAG
jgi:glycosyltransferase involved in cell wall biosynthesis